MKCSELYKYVVKILRDDDVIVGTGFFVTSTGFILTCHHVIAALPKLVIEYNKIKIEKVMYCPSLSLPEHDIAVLKINPEELRIAIFEISPDDFSDEIESAGQDANAYGFPSDKTENHPNGHNIHGKITPGELTRPPIRQELKQALEALREKFSWNVLPDVEMQAFNLENADATPGASGSPVVCSNKIIGFIVASHSGDRRAYVIKWEHLRKKWKNFPLSPAPPDLISKEWAVKEARDEIDFIDKIRNFRSIVGKAFNDNVDDLVITFYAKPFDQQGVGYFEYDLLYYWNVSDPTFMFGPIITDDARTKITEDRKLWDKRDLRDGPGRSGGFIDRENIYQAAWFKLGSSLWKRNNSSNEEVRPQEIQGLLFVNSREQEYIRENLECVALKKALADLEDILPKVIKKRREHRSNRTIRLINELSKSEEINKIRNKDAHDITPADINTFLTRASDIYENISGKSKLAFTVFTWEEPEQQLDWLWSNSPTSIKASTRFPGQSTHKLPLVAQVALDNGHIPRLVHNVKDNQKYREQVIIAKLGSEVQSNLVVPILAQPEKELLGIIDLQGSKGTEFDSDTMQLVYYLSDLRIADFLTKIKQHTSKLSLLRNPEVQTFPKQELEPNIHDMLKLNFNPMKYLFHWQKIENLVQDKAIEFPALVEIWPTMLCNQHCDWCRTDRDRADYQGKNKYIGPDGLDALAQDLVSQDRVDLLISGGGEPLLHRNIHEFMRFLKEKGNFGNLGVFTNGFRPRDFRFWEYFFETKSRHAFIRVSFNGHCPETYYQVHFNREAGDEGKDFPKGYEKPYAEALKIVEDLLALRSRNCTIALGTTIHSLWADTIKKQIAHAKQVGVDFIQIRPELVESSHGNADWKDLKETVEHERKQYINDKNFGVIYTDNERAYKDHDYDTCYAMYLAPTLIPDKEKNQIIILPCSYARNRVGSVPILGVMKEGTTLSNFWNGLNIAMGFCPNEKMPVGISEIRDRPINPKMGCPQCRYYCLNKRIITIKNNKDKVHLIGKLVQALEKDPCNFENANIKLINDVKDAWEPWVVDIAQAKEAFMISKRLGIRPSL